jgi:hypothetical protein
MISWLQFGRLDKDEDNLNMLPVGRLILSKDAGNFPVE